MGGEKGRRKGEKREGREGEREKGGERRERERRGGRRGEEEKREEGEKGRKGGRERRREGEKGRGRERKGEGGRERERGGEKGRGREMCKKGEKGDGKGGKREREEREEGERVGKRVKKVENSGRSHRCTASRGSCTRRKDGRNSLGERDWTLQENQQSRSKTQRHRSCTHQVGSDRQSKRKQTKSEMQPCGENVGARTKGALLAHELFSAMPPWEIFKVLLGLLVSDNVPGAEGEELEMAIFDISRAHFMAPMDREACIELPKEDKLPEDETQ